MGRCAAWAAVPVSAYTKADYGSFRLIFTARMNPVNKDHLGVLFWGDRPKDPSKPKIDNAGWIQFMPPHGAMWDYHPPKHHNLPHETLAEGSRDFTKWSTTELLCNLEKGTLRAAVDGVEIVRYTHPTPASERTRRNGSFQAPSDVPPRFRCVRIQSHLRRGESERRPVAHCEVSRQLDRKSLIVSIRDKQNRTIQRDCGAQPRVGAARLPWVKHSQIPNRTAVVANSIWVRERKDLDQVIALANTSPVFRPE
jgi:hypothetical protein